jgi:hypothetical protein
MVFAHQGGWDEMLLVLGPILVIVLAPARWPANRAGQGDRRAAPDSDPD